MFSFLLGGNIESDAAGQAARETVEPVKDVIAPGYIGERAQGSVTGDLSIGTTPVVADDGNPEPGLQQPETGSIWNAGSGPDQGAPPATLAGATGDYRSIDRQISTAGRAAALERAGTFGDGPMSYGIGIAPTPYAPFGAVAFNASDSEGLAAGNNSLQAPVMAGRGLAVQRSAEMTAVRNQTANVISQWWTATGGGTTS